MIADGTKLARGLFAEGTLASDPSLSRIAMSDGVRTVSALEFARRFKYGVSRRATNFAWFVGAGCSVSSGVPDAATIAKRWAGELKYLETGDASDVELWAHRRFAAYDPDDPAKIYATALRTLFYSEQDQVCEIERILSEAEPGFGYATLSQLMTHERWGRFCNIAITVNFDDLLAEALQLYSQRRPNVLTHESLGRRTPLSKIAPTIVKIHGDAHLGPQWRVRGRTLLDRDVRDRLRAQITESGLVFLGYGGRDDSVLDLLEGLPRGAPGGGVFWVGSTLPDGALREWLIGRGGVWVRHRDFDELMFIVRLEFALGHPKIDRFERILRRYQAQYRALAARAKPRTPGAQPRREARLYDIAEKPEARKTRDGTRETASFPPPPPNEAQEAAGLSSTPGTSVPDQRSEAREKLRQARRLAAQDNWCGSAEGLYGEAVRSAHTDPALLCEAAEYLLETRRSPKKTQSYLHRALARNIRHGEALRLLARFLMEARGDVKGAEDALRVAVSTGHVRAMLDYARLAALRGATERAGEMAERILGAPGADPATLAQLAVFLLQDLDSPGPAKEAIARAGERGAAGADLALARALHARRCGKNLEAGMYFRRALEGKAGNRHALLAYAAFAVQVKRDDGAAEKALRRAVKSAPRSGEALAHLAGFLQLRMKGERLNGKQANRGDEAKKFFARALDLEPWNPVLLMLAGDFHEARNESAETKELAAQLRKRLSRLASPAAIARMRQRFVENYAPPAPASERPAPEMPAPETAALESVASETAPPETAAGGDDGTRAISRPGMRVARNVLAEADAARATLEKVPIDASRNRAIAVRLADNLDRIQSAVETSAARESMDGERSGLAALARAARFLLAGGRKGEGLSLLKQAQSRLAETQGDSVDTIALELDFCQYAHDGENRSTALARIMTRLERGVRIEGRDLTDNVLAAIREGHPSGDFLRDLSRVISDGVDSSLLRRHVA